MQFFKHPTAIVESENIGEGTKIWHFVHVREGARIGRDCIVGKSAYIDLDVEIGDRVKIQNFVSIYKGVKIEDDVFIGPSVTFTNDLYPRADSWREDKITHTLIKRGASIGEYAMVGAGSVVTRDIPSFTLVYGNPARIGGRVNKEGLKV
ncbi:MAG: N-acetyltransferase [Candidatus Syntrophoarchaeum sp.]|nr:N-acetyltransferase [Candidatus Syntrophoarchaeum sp.]